MDVIDKHFLKLPRGRKVFVFVIGIGFLLTAVTGYRYGLTNFAESFLIFVIGILYTEIIKLSYRVESLEGKKK